MKKIALLACLLIPMLGFSQDGYPKMVIKDGDTLIEILPKHLVKINQTKFDLEYFKEKSVLQDSLNSNLKTQVSELELNIEDYKEVTSLKDSIINEKHFQYQTVADENEVLKKNEKKLKLTRKVFTFVGTGIGGGLGFIIGRATKK